MTTKQVTVYIMVCACDDERYGNNKKVEVMMFGASRRSFTHVIRFCGYFPFSIAHGPHPLYLTFLSSYNFCHHSLDCIFFVPDLNYALKSRIWTRGIRIDENTSVFWPKMSWTWNKTHHNPIFTGELELMKLQKHSA
jgi:hypothetical protein